MRPSLLKLCLLVLCLFGSPDSMAEYGVTVAYGNGTKNIHSLRLNLDRTWTSPCITTNCRRINGYWELSFSKMTGNQLFVYPTNKHLEAVTTSAAIRLQKKIGMLFYLDLGLGLAYMSKDEISSRELGSNLIFEDRLGLGVLLGTKKQFEIGCRLIHYSNAYLAKVNHGLNLHLLELGYWFN